MKKLTYIFAILAFTFYGCEDALDTTNYTDKTTSTFPESYDDANQMLAGVYQNLSQVSANPQMSFFYLSTLASDDNYGGGGGNDKLMQALDILCNYQENMLQQFWSDRYTGIFRANSLINAIDNCKGFPSEDAKNRILGEALTLRAFYYYELISQFGRIPLITTPSTEDLPQSSAADVFGQILLDLKTAFDIMPAERGLDGHLDKYGAGALLGRAWLYYTGMYCNGEDITEITSTNYSPLTSVTLADGSTLTKENVISVLDAIVSSNAYSLVNDYQNLWAYTNSFTVEDYPYTSGKGFAWVQNDNAVNPESMFAIKYNKLASWQTTIGYGNSYSLHFGIRGGQAYGNTFPFGQGWGAGPVTPNLVREWATAEPTDLRREASIQDVKELPNYTYGGWSDFIQETDYYAKKQSPVSCKNTTLTDKFPDDEYLACFDIAMYGPDGWSTDAAPINMQLNNIHDLILVRFADVLLMQSELKENVEGINKVRTRAKLTPIGGYSLDALQKERRWELAFEGTRWNDIRRWHIAADALDKQLGQNIYVEGTPTTNTPQNGGYSSRYKATAGFFKIPEAQISLSEVLTQNPGWTGGDAEYAGWNQ